MNNQELSILTFINGLQETSKLLDISTEVLKENIKQQFLNSNFYSQIINQNPEKSFQELGLQPGLWQVYQKIKEQKSLDSNTLYKQEISSDEEISLQSIEESLSPLNIEDLQEIDNLNENGLSKEDENQLKNEVRCQESQNESSLIKEEEMSEISKNGKEEENEKEQDFEQEQFNETLQYKEEDNQENLNDTEPKQEDDLLEKQSSQKNVISRSNSSEIENQDENQDDIDQEDLIQIKRKKKDQEKESSLDDQEKLSSSQESFEEERIKKKRKKNNQNKKKKKTKQNRLKKKKKQSKFEYDSSNESESDQDSDYIENSDDDDKYEDSSFSYKPRKKRKKQEEDEDFAYEEEIVSDNEHQEDIKIIKTEDCQKEDEDHYEENEDSLIQKEEQTEQNELQEEDKFDEQTKNELINQNPQFKTNFSSQQKLSIVKQALNGTKLIILSCQHEVPQLLISKWIQHYRKHKKVPNQISIACKMSNLRQIRTHYLNGLDVHQIQKKMRIHIYNIDFALFNIPRYERYKKSIYEKYIQQNGLNDLIHQEQVYFTKQDKLKAIELYREQGVKSCLKAFPNVTETILYGWAHQYEKNKKLESSYVNVRLPSQQLIQQIKQLIEDGNTIAKICQTLNITRSIVTHTILHSDIQTKDLMKKPESEDQYFMKEYIQINKDKKLAIFKQIEEGVKPQKIAAELGILHDQLNVWHNKYKSTQKLEDSTVLKFTPKSSTLTEIRKMYLEGKSVHGIQKYYKCHWKNFSSMLKSWFPDMEQMQIQRQEILQSSQNQRSEQKSQKIREMKVKLYDQDAQSQFTEEQKKEIVEVATTDGIRQACKLYKGLSKMLLVHWMHIHKNSNPYFSCRKILIDVESQKEALKKYKSGNYSFFEILRDHQLSRCDMYKIIQMEKKGKSLQEFSKYIQEAKPKLINCIKKQVAEGKNLEEIRKELKISEDRFKVIVMTHLKEQNQVNKKEDKKFSQEMHSKASLLLDQDYSIYEISKKLKVGQEIVKNILKDQFMNFTI